METLLLFYTKEGNPVTSRCDPMCRVVHLQPRIIRRGGLRERYSFDVLPCVVALGWDN